MRSTDKAFTDRNAKLTALLVAGFLFLAALGCSGGKSKDAKPIPSQYFGAWTGEDGSTIAIRGDGTGDYKSGGTSINGGTVEINDADNTISIIFFSFGKTLKIDKAPSGNQMTLGGVIYKKNDGSDSKSDQSSSNSKPDSSSGQVPGDDKLQSMAKTTMLDFNDAVQSGDFTDFYGKVAKLWQEQTSPDALLDAFRPFVDQKADVNFAGVKNLEATFTPAPSIDTVSGHKVLVLKGYYPTTPRKSSFELKYVMEDDSWKLLGIKINTKDQ